MRDAIRKDIQNLLTGWGMWVETIEISDVRICSGSLFKNMQVDFREANRLKAHELKSASDLIIDKRQIEDNQKQQMATAKQKAEQERLRLEAQAERNKFVYEYGTKKQKETRVLNDAINETEIKNQTNELALEGDKKDNELAIKKLNLELESDKLTANTIKEKMAELVCGVKYQVRTNSAQFINIDEGAMGSMDDKQMQN